MSDLIQKLHTLNLGGKHYIFIKYYLYIVGFFKLQPLEDVFSCRALGKIS